MFCPIKWRPQPWQQGPDWVSMTDGILNDPLFRKKRGGEECALFFSGFMGHQPNQSEKEHQPEASMAQPGRGGSHLTFLGKTEDELKEIFLSLGEPAFRGKQAFHRVNKLLSSHLDEFTEFSKPLREQLKELGAMPETRILKSSLSVDGTEKILMEAPVSRNRIAGIETVWLLSGKRRTICASSQSGCSLNCSFCATASLPFQGNLSAASILEQIYGIIRHRKEMPSNIVFMGMGEPLLNYENVMKAAEILHHPNGLHLSARHITISTAGVIPGIEQMIREKRPFNLAVSLNQADSDQRAKLMDVEKKYPLKKLIPVLKDFVRINNRPITFEYVMIPGENMSRQDAKNLIRTAKSVKSKINLIPLNTTTNGMRPPTDDEIVDFQETLFDAGLHVFNRGSAGKDIDGACGMLALKY